MNYPYITMKKGFYIKVFGNFMEIESLLTFFVRKNCGKRRKIRNMLRDLQYNDETREYSVHSSRNHDRVYKVIYSNAARDWKCECEAKTYKRYKRYSSPEERHQLREPDQCIHIIACKIHSFLN